jgi:hypothetical protein
MVFRIVLTPEASIVGRTDPRRNDIREPASEDIIKNQILFN